MPNFTTFNTNPDNLRTLIFGHDSTGTAQPVHTDTSGNVLGIILDGTISNISGLTTVTINAGTITNILNGTITSVLGATITAGTITSVLGATITAGTLT
ncbi:hypothetical protein C3548_23295, partial [Salmonella enterica]|nr:hypothetical protein [Salmonella enterica]